jgi:hypothetical protein
MSEHLTPSASIIASAQKTGETKDVLGRVIKYRRLQALDRLRLFKAVGAQNASNAPYVGMAILAASVTSVDEWVAPFPTRESEVEMLVQRLGDAGIDAIANALTTDDIAKAIAAEEARAAAFAEGNGANAPNSAPAGA